MTTSEQKTLQKQRVIRTQSEGGIVQIQLGSSIAKVYPIQNRGKQDYQVSWHAGGRRYRTTYMDKEEAIKHAVLAVKKLNAGEAQVLSLVNQDRQDYLAARRLLTPHQINLVHAAKDYTEALKLLNGVPLLTAVKSYIKSQGNSLTPISAEALVQKLIQTRTEDGASPRYVADLRSRLGRFGKAIQKPISSITTPELDKWLRDLNIKPRNRRNFRTLLVALFLFAREQGYPTRQLSVPAFPFMINFGWI